ncbi:MAG: hypothetical protein F4X99_16650, partial [Gammaproteobacteria bacterium]|nr:hypothetical protein [Gammaproteobacteria bacterium]
LVARGATLATMAAALACAAPATAAVLVSNIDQTASGTETLNGRLVVHEFTTGAGAGGYTLTSVEVKFSAAPNSTVRVRLLQGDRDGSVHATLTNPAALAAGNLTFTAPSGTTLAASTTYALAIDSATSGTLSQANTDAIDSGGAPGWSIAISGDTSQDAGGNWISSAFEVLFRVNGDPVDQAAPTFVTAWADGTALTLLFDEPLGTATLANTAFAVKKRGADGTESTVDLGTTAPSVSGSAVVLTLASALASTDRRVTVAYTKPATGTGNRIVDAAGNEAESFAEYVADVLLSNMDQPTYFQSQELNGLTEAMTFLTGSHATGYALASVEVKFETAPNSSLRVRVFDTVPTGVQGTFRPGTTLIAKLAHPPSLAAGNLRFTAPAGTTLSANTRYAIVVDSATSGSINYTVSSEVDASGESRWNIRGRLRKQGGSWTPGSAFWQLRVSGTPKPVPLVSNIKQSKTQGISVGVSGASNIEAAVLFTTGPGEAGYTLAEVDAELASVSSSASPKVSIYTTSAGVPASSKHVLTTPDDVGNGVQTFTAPAGATLDANTTYAVVFQNTAASGTYQVWETTSDDEDAGAASDVWEIADASHSRDGASSTSTWTNPSTRAMRIAVRGRPEDRTPPTLASGLVNGTKLTLTFSDPLALPVLFDEHGVLVSPTNSAFTVKKAGAGGTETDVSLSTSTAPSVSEGKLVLTLATALASADRGFKVSYTQPGSGTANRIVNEAGLAAESFSDEAAARALVSNLREAQSTTDLSLSITTFDFGQSFTTGGSDAGYTLASVEVGFVQASDSTLRVRVVEGLDPAGTNVVATLTNPSSLGRDTNTFTAQAVTKLAAGTSYTLVLDTSRVGQVSSTDSDAEDAGVAPGWSIGNNRSVVSKGDPVWFFRPSSLRISVNGEPLTKPAVTDIQISSTPSHDENDDDTPETYGRGANIRVQVTFDKAVNVVTTDGTPRLKIDFSSEAWGEQWVPYETGTGTKVLTFAYEVVTPNRSTEGVAVLQNTLELNGGTIKDAADATIDASLAHTGLPHNTAHLVESSLEPDETAPSFASATVNGKALAVTFGEALDPASAPAGSAFEVTGGRTGTGTATLSEATATVELDAAVPAGETVTVSYTHPGTGNSPLRDGSGNEVATFSGGMVTNNARPPPPPPCPAGQHRHGGYGCHDQDEDHSPPPPVNEAPEIAEAIGDLTLRVGAEVEIDLSDAFRDPEGDDLEYAAESSDPGVAAVELDGAALTVRAGGAGEAKIAATAEDPDGARARQTFDVAVRWPETVWYLPPMSDPARQGFVRVINHSDAAGAATLTATDDAGVAYEALTLALGPRQARHFNSDDLELGNPDKGL